MAVRHDRGQRAGLGPRGWLLAATLMLPVVALPSPVEATDSGGNAQHSQDSPQRARDLADRARGAYDEIIGEKNGATTGAAARDATQPRQHVAQATQRELESGVDWLVRAKRGYSDVIRRLSEPTAPNPVADAARRSTTERAAPSATETRAPAPAATEVAPPKVLPPLAEAPPTAETPPTVTVQEAPAANQPSSGSGEPSGDSVIDKAVAAINEANTAFQENIVDRLATPAPEAAASSAPAKVSAPAKASGSAAEQPGPPQQPTDQAASPQAAAKARQAALEQEAKARAKADRLAKEAEQKAERERLAKAQQVENERLRDEARRAEIARKAAEAARIADNQRRRADIAKAEADRKEAAAEWRAAEARRLADVQRAEEARLAEAKETEKAEAKKARLAEEKKAQAEARRARIEADKAAAAAARIAAKAAENEVLRAAREAAALANAIPKVAAGDADSRNPANSSKSKSHSGRRVATVPPAPGTRSIGSAKSGTAAIVRPSEIPRPGGFAARGPAHGKSIAGGANVEPDCTGAGVVVQRPGWYVVASGDSLTVIAKAHYGTGREYRRILRANRGRINEVDVIRPCQKLFIPD